MNAKSKDESPLEDASEEETGSILGMWILLYMHKHEPYVNLCGPFPTYEKLMEAAHEFMAQAEQFPDISIRVYSVDGVLPPSALMMYLQAEKDLVDEGVAAELLGWLNATSDKGTIWELADVSMFAKCACCEVYPTLDPDECPILDRDCPHWDFRGKWANGEQVEPRVIVPSTRTQKPALTLVQRRGLTPDLWAEVSGICGTGTEVWSAIGRPGSWEWNTSPAVQSRNLLHRRGWRYTPDETATYRVMWSIDPTRISSREEEE